MKALTRLILIAVTAALLLSACSPTEAEMRATETRIAINVFNTQTAMAPKVTDTPTLTPTPTATLTPTPTPTPTATITPKPTPEPCGHVDLNGRYTDYRVVNNIDYGWVMDVEQHGCEITATEYFYVKINGPGSIGYGTPVTGTITDDRVKICYTRSGYCLNLVIMEGGNLLVNGVMDWHFEKIGEVPEG